MHAGGAAGRRAGRRRQRLAGDAATCMLPYIRGTLMVAGLFRLIDSIKAFPLIYLLTDGGPGAVTEVTNYYAFQQAFNFSYLGFSSAITVVLVGGDPGAELVGRAADRLGRSRMSTAANRADPAGLVDRCWLLLVLAPFLWLVRMSFQTNAEIFAFPPRLLFTPTLANYAALWQGEFRALLRQQPGGQRRRPRWSSLVVGVPAAYALARMRSRSERAEPVDPRQPAGAADRLHDPVLPGLPRSRPAGHADSGSILIYLTFNLSLVIWLMRSFFENTPRALEEAAWIDGAGLWQALSASCCRSPRPASRRRRSCVSCSPGTTSSSR